MCEQNHDVFRQHQLIPMCLRGVHQWRYVDGGPVMTTGLNPSLANTLLAQQLAALRRFHISHMPPIQTLKAFSSYFERVETNRLHGKMCTKLQATYHIRSSPCRTEAGWRRYKDYHLSFIEKNIATR